MKHLFALLIFGFSLSALAASKNTIARGGFGLLFVDHNSMRNVGETARTQGFAVQGLWAKFTGTHEQSLVGAAAYGSGTWAVSAFGSRYGMALTDSAQSEDMFGAYIGFAPGDLSFSLGYEREHDIYQTIARVPVASVVRGTVTYAGKGPLAIGLAVDTTVDRVGTQDQTFELAIGLKGSSAALEAVQTWTRDSGDWSTGLLGRWQGQMFYIAGGGIYQGTAEAVQVLARLGLVWKAVDVSGFVTHIVKNNENPFHGLTVRLAI